MSLKFDMEVEGRFQFHGKLTKNYLKLWFKATWTIYMKQKLAKVYKFLNIYMKDRFWILMS